MKTLKKKQQKEKYMNEKRKNLKFIVQDSLYNFPYHYLPENIEQKITKPFRVYYWLYDYLFLVNYLINRVNQFQFENLLDFGCGDGRFINDLKKLKEATYMVMKFLNKPHYFLMHLIQEQN